MFPEILVIFDEFQQYCMWLGMSWNKRQAGRPSAPNEEVVEDIRTRMEIIPRTSIRKLSLQTGLILILSIHQFPHLSVLLLIFHTTPTRAFTGYSTVLKKRLRYHPYKMSILQSLTPPDYPRRVLFCNWFNAVINNNDILDNTFFFQWRLVPSWRLREQAELSNLVRSKSSDHQNCIHLKLAFG
jgi:hypothetical protein